MKNRSFRLKGPKIFHSLLLYLHDERAHYFTYNLGVEKAVSQIGLAFHAYVPKSCILNLPKNWTKFFKTSRLNALQRFLDFKRVFGGKEEGRFIFLEAYNFWDLSLFLLANFCFAKKRDVTLLMCRTGFPTQALKRFLFSLPLKTLLLKMGKRFVFLTDNESAVHEVQTLFKRPCYVMPVIPLAPIERSCKPTLCPISCYWPGIPQPRKGLKEIEKLLTIEDLHAQNFSLSVAEDAPLLLPQNNLSIRRVKAALSRRAFLKELCDAEIVFLPYDPLLHKKASSGIFVEAIVAGCIPLVKEGSWLALELRKYDLAELIVSWDHPHFFTYLLTLYEDRKMLTKLAAMRAAYRKFHSIDSYSEKLREIILQF